VVRRHRADRQSIVDYIGEDLMGSAAERRPALVAWFAIWTVLTAFSGTAVAAAWMNHDVGWYLYAGGAWLNGAVLYRDVVDPNPPLIIALMAAVVWSARVLGLRLTTLFQTAVFVACTAVTGCAAALVRRIYSAETARLLLSASIAFLLLPLAGADYGQREHLATLLVLPYALGSAARIAARPLSPRAELALAVLAGAGFALKPHFLLAWIGLEAVKFVSQERPRALLTPGAVAIAAVLLSYWLAVLVFVPQYFDVASDVMRVYRGLNAPAATLLRLPDIRVWVVGALVLALAPLPRVDRRICLGIFAVCTGFLAAALSQQKGWGYHLYPFRVFAGLFFAMAIAANVHDGRASMRFVRALQRAVTAAIIAALMLAAWKYRKEIMRPSGIEQVELLEALVRRERVDSMAMLSMRTMVFPAFPIVTYTGASWAMRHNSLWFLPGLYAEQLRAGGPEIPWRALHAMDPLERRYFEEIVADLCAHPPRLLLVEPPPAWARPGGGSIDLVEYYQQDERFARLFAGYRLNEQLGPFSAYLRRNDLPCSADQGIPQPPLISPVSAARPAPDRPHARSTCIRAHPVRGESSLPPSHNP